MTVVPGTITNALAEDSPVPRWEWRAFARKNLARRVAAHIASSVTTTSEETYFISAHSPHSVRIRGHRVEARELLASSVEGIERWHSILVSGFPLSAAVLHRIVATWRLNAPPGQVACETETALKGLAARTTGVLPIAVTKTRRTFHFRHCLAEFVELTILGDRWESIALKDVDLAVVRVAVEALGLGGVISTDYPAALARIAGFHRAT